MIVRRERQQSALSSGRLRQCVYVTIRNLGHFRTSMRFIRLSALYIIMVIITHGNYFIPNSWYFHEVKFLFYWSTRTKFCMHRNLAQRMLCRKLQLECYFKPVQVQWIQNPEGGLCGIFKKKRQTWFAWAIKNEILSHEIYQLYGTCSCI